jgi:3-keto-5-aminohexanoate cleavage enzyme
VFDLGMAHVIEYLQQRKLAPTPAYANLLFGNLYSAQADLLDIAAVVNRLPSHTVWSLAGLGAAQLPVASVAAAFAPAVRIGLEDNLWLDRGRTQLATNAALIERVHMMASAVGREIMKPSEFRAALRLSAPPAHLTCQ